MGTRYLLLVYSFLVQQYSKHFTDVYWRLGQKVLSIDELLGSLLFDIIRASSHGPRISLKGKM